MATTCSYQASFDGFQRAGVGRADAEELLRRSVRLADAARERFWAEHSQRLADAGDEGAVRGCWTCDCPVTPPNISSTEVVAGAPGALPFLPSLVVQVLCQPESLSRPTPRACAGGLSSSDGGRADEAGGSFRPECNGGAAVGEGSGEGYSGARQGLAGWQWARGRPLVAFSLGSYGAALADGSEFTGAYARRVTEEQLLEFHRARIQVPCPAGHTACCHKTAIPNHIARCEILVSPRIECSVLGY